MGAAIAAGAKGPSELHDKLVLELRTKLLPKFKKKSCVKGGPKEELPQAAVDAWAPTFAARIAKATQDGFVPPLVSLLFQALLKAHLKNDPSMSQNKVRAALQACATQLPPGARFVLLMDAVCNPAMAAKNMLTPGVMPSLTWLFELLVKGVDLDYMQMEVPRLQTCTSPVAAAFAAFWSQHSTKAHVVQGAQARARAAQARRVAEAAAERERQAAATKRARAKREEAAAAQAATAVAAAALARAKAGVQAARARAEAAAAPPVVVNMAAVAKARAVDAAEKGVRVHEIATAHAKAVAAATIHSALRTVARTVARGSAMTELAAQVAVEGPPLERVTPLQALKHHNWAAIVHFIAHPEDVGMAAAFAWKVVALLGTRHKANPFKSAVDALSAADKKALLRSKIVLHWAQAQVKAPLQALGLWGHKGLGLGS